MLLCLQIFFLLLPVSFFWDPHYTYINSLDGVPQFLGLCSFMFIFFFLWLRLDNLNSLIFKFYGSFLFQFKFIVEPLVNVLCQLFYFQLQNFYLMLFNNSYVLILGLWWDTVLMLSFKSSAMVSFMSLNIFILSDLNFCLNPQI